MDIPPVNTHMKEILTMKKTVAKLLLLSVILLGFVKVLDIANPDSNNNVSSYNLFDDATLDNTHK